MIYDYIILGGGISGLYSAYLLTKKHPNKSILILESESVVGGRIHTYSDKYMTVEAGAGRFNRKHKLLIELLGELGLSDKIVSISGNIEYMPQSLNNQTLQQRQPIQTNLSSRYIAQIMESSKREPTEKLRSMSFLNYAKTILSPEETKYIEDSFGYYSELVIMNAYDALHLMRDLGPTNKFAGLIGGLSEMIIRLSNLLKTRGCRIMCKKTVQNIVILQNSSVVLHSGVLTTNTDTLNAHNASIISVYCKENQTPYKGHVCICALPKQVAENLPYFRKLRPLFTQIVCAPLCRIYSVFPTKNNETPVWFSGLHKFATNNNLRMVIPISEKDGVIMISYSDNKYANWWNNLYNTKGEEGVNRELARLIRKSIGIDIPKPIETKVFHWKCGVGYWGIGADSKNFPLQPDKSVPVYLSGEHYSWKSQQWIEGALETASRVVAQI